MIEIKTNEALDILDKLQFFQGQRAGRELWLDKPPVVQEQDLYNFNRDIEKIRSYIQTKNNMMQEILNRLEEKKKNICGSYNWETPVLERPSCKVAFNNGICEAIEIVKEVGGMNESTL